MNILFICDEYPPGKNGGIGTMVQVLSRELARQGHKVFVAGLYAHSYGEKNFEEDGSIKVWRFRYGWDLKVPAGHILHKLFNRIPSFIKQHLNGKNAFGKFIAFINTLVENENIDIIEIADWNTFAMRIGFLVEWPAFKIPLVVKMHGSYTYLASELNTPAKQWLCKIDKALYERADALSAVSAYTAGKNKTLFGLGKEIKILNNAIESRVNDTTIKREEFRVVFSGTLIALKGIFQLMKAWNIVNNKIPGAELIIFGKGNTSVLKKLLNKQAIHTVSFAGHVKREVLLHELSKATLAVFPSFTETFGLAVIEAMSAGCPVIFTKRASGPEIVTDKVNGELIDPESIEEIARAITRILNDKSLQLKYALNGKKTVSEKFNIAESAIEHILFYNTVIKKFYSKKVINHKS